MHAIEPLSPELALVDPDLRRRALAYPAPVLAHPAASPRPAPPAPPRRSRPVSAVALYATIRLLEVLMIGAVAALFLALSIALMVAVTP
jgi:hypothetical protein